MPVNPEIVIQLVVENRPRIPVVGEQEPLAQIRNEGDLASIVQIGPDRLAHVATLPDREPTTTGESPTVAADARKAG
jgi:hypothetical protein